MDYILVIHGTWNPPDGTAPMWYQLDAADPTNFCRRLNERLEEKGVAGAIWPSRGGIVDFSWSGDNDHTARQRASDELAGLMHRIGRSDPGARIHLIGHSHGGNVALKAVDLLCRRLSEDAKQLATSVLGQADDLPGAAGRAVERALDDDSERRLDLARPWLEDLARQAFPLLARDYVIRRWPRAALARRKWLLLTAGPVRDVYRLFVSRWVAARGPASVTFLGTPFYRKIWRRPRTAVRFLRRLPGTMVAISLMSAPSIYLVVMLYSALLAALPGVTMVSWNPLEWPTWLKVLSVAVLLAAVGMFGAETDTRDTNLYFDEVDLSGSDSPVSPRIPALVVSAGRLDEALVALSSEPFAFAYLIPQLRALLAPPMRWSHPESTGRVATYSQIGEAVLGFLGQAVRNLGYAVAAPLWMPLRRWVVTPLLTEVLLKTVNASAFGVPPNELSTARILVGSRLDLPAWFDQSYHDVADLLLRAPPPAAPAARASAMADRYAFLTSDDRLEQKKHSSILWKRIQGAVPDLRRRYGSGDPAAIERDLALNVIALEERIKEIAGNVDLNHSWYYTNGDVIEMVASFISSACHADRRVSTAPGAASTETTS